MNHLVALFFEGFGLGKYVFDSYAFFIIIFTFLWVLFFLFMTDPSPIKASLEGQMVGLSSQNLGCLH